MKDASDPHFTAQIAVEDFSGPTLLIACEPHASGERLGLAINPHVGLCLVTQHQQTWHWVPGHVLLDQTCLTEPGGAALFSERPFVAANTPSLTTLASTLSRLCAAPETPHQIAASFAAQTDPEVVYELEIEDTLGAIQSLLFATLDDAQQQARSRLQLWLDAFADEATPAEAAPELGPWQADGEDEWSTASVPGSALSFTLSIKKRQIESPAPHKR